MHAPRTHALDLLTRWLVESARPTYPGEAHRELSRAIRLLPDEGRDLVADIMERVVVQAGVTAIERPVFDRRAIRVCMAAFVRCRAVVVQQRGSAPQHVEPHCVLIRSPLWHLLCTYRDTSVVCSLRLDRIRAAAPLLHGDFEPRRLDRLLLASDRRPPSGRARLHDA